MNTMLTDRVLRRDDVGPPGVIRTELDRFLEAQDAGRMGPRLEQSLGRGPSTCHVLDAKFEPGLRAILLYEHAGRLVRGDLVADDDHASGHVVAPGVRLSRFPDDPEMPKLRRFMDPGRLGRALTDALGQTPYRVPRSGPRCRLRLLRYRPGKRATLLVDLPGVTGRYVVKAYHDAAKATAVAEEAPGLAAAFSGDSGSLRIAPTVAHLPELDAVVQTEVAGTPLDALLLSPGATAVQAGVAAAGRALAELHDAQVTTRRERPVEKELRRFVSRAGRIASVDPHTGAVLGRLAERLLRVHGELPDPGTGPVHGDCKPSQFLCRVDHVYLMDLDHVGLSDQAADVGTFLASLRQLGVRRSLGRSTLSGGSEGLAALATVFLEAYVDGRGRPGDEDRIRWQEAAALERKALRAFARAPRSPVALALAAEADRCLDMMGATA